MVCHMERDLSTFKSLKEVNPHLQSGKGENILETKKEVRVIRGQGQRRLAWIQGQKEHGPLREKSPHLLAPEGKVTSQGVPFS